MRPDSVTGSTLPLSGGRRDLHRVDDHDRAACWARVWARRQLVAPVWMMLPLKVSPSTICGAEPAVVKKMGRQVQPNQTGRPSDLSQHANLIETLLDERTRPVQALWHRRFWALPSGRSTFEFRWTAAVQRSELASAPDEVAEVVGRGAVGGLEADLYQDAERCVIPRSDCRPESAAPGACCRVNRGAGGFGRVPVALVHAQQFVCQLRLSYARAT